METYNGPVPSVNGVFEFERTSSKDVYRAIGLCVADALSSLYD